MSTVNANDNDTIILTDGADENDFGNFTELSQEINKTEAGEILNITKNYKAESNGGIAITKAITIEGNGHTINGNNLTRIFNITSDEVIFKNLKIINGNSCNGSAIYIHGASNTLQIINTTFENHYTTENGAIYCQNSKVEVKDSTFSSNDANMGGALYIDHSEIMISNAEFVNNSARTGGAIFCQFSTINITNSNFTKNKAKNTPDVSGGAIYTQASTNNISNCKFENNTLNGTTKRGSDIYCNKYSTTQESTIFLENNTFTNNNDNNSIILEIENTKTTINNCIFENNTQIRNVISLISLTNGSLINASKFDNNTNIKGTIIYISGTDNYEIFNSNFTNNTLEIKLNNGNAVIYSTNANNTIFENCNFQDNNFTSLSYLHQYNTNINNCNFINSTYGLYFSNTENITALNCIFKDSNKIYREGGGINLYASTNFNTDNCSFINLNSSMDGGAIYLYNSQANINNTKFYNNSASENGGAISLTNSRITITNSELENNTANGGGAIYIFSDSSCNISNTTFTNNSVNSIYWKENTQSVVNNSYFTPYYDNFVYEENVEIIKHYYNMTKINASFDYANASDIEITIRGYSNKLLTNWTVNLTLTKGSVSQILEKTTDENGVVILSEAELNPLEAGNWTLNITIAGDDNYYDITTENSIEIKAIKTNLVMSDVNASLDLETTLNVTIVCENAKLINEGIVEFFDNDVSIGNSSVIDGKASIKYAPKVYGSHTLKANYSMTNNYTDSNTESAMLVDCVFIKIDSYEGTVGYDFTIQANLSTLYHDIEDGVVKFYEDNTLVGTADIVNNVSQFLFTPKHGGNHIIKAVYCESSKFNDSANSSSIQINKSSTTTTSVNITATFKDTVVIKANVKSSNDLDVNDSEIEVYMDNRIIGKANVENGVASLRYTPQSAGNHKIDIFFIENYNYLASNTTINLNVNKISTKITSTAISMVYNSGKYLIATLTDKNNNALKGYKMEVTLNGKVIPLTTDSKGQIKVSTNNLNSKTYHPVITFKGNENYQLSKITAKITVKKASTKLTATAKTFKSNVKSKKYQATLKYNKKKAVKKAKVSLKVNGKTYTGKTNSKGVVTFKITKLTKKGTFNAKVIFSGNTNFKKVSKSVKITVK